jgi:hypothetical protein
MNQGIFEYPYCFSFCDRRFWSEGSEGQEQTNSVELGNCDRGAARERPVDVRSAKVGDQVGFEDDKIGKAERRVIIPADLG